MTNHHSRELFEQAKKVIPGGVNSPVRAFGSVGGDPLFIDRGSGSYLFDVDGNRYIDYVQSWGPLILGHAHPRVVEGLRRAAQFGTSYGAPTVLEMELARLIVQSFKSIEKVRLVSSGTEATMSAIRLARAYNDRSKVVKFDGCYHGHVDSLLVAAGSGVMTLGIPGSPGVTEGTVRDTIQARYNDLEQVSQIVAEQGREISCIIVEPVAGNMGVVPPKDGFLEGLRELTTKNGSILIFDEVITGFRLGIGGAQEMYEVNADLTTLGKIIGGGLPVGAYGGKREIMEQIAPCGPVYQAGTLSGNPLATTAGIETLNVLKGGRERPLAEAGSIYDQLERHSYILADGLMEAAHRADIPLQVNRVGSMMTAFFTECPVTDYDSARKADTSRYARFFRAMLDRGVYLPPSQFEAMMVSAAHSDEDIDDTIQAAADAMAMVKKCQVA